MYLNMCQKYILELLREYDGLLKRQLEFMTKRFVEPHLFDIDGYVHCMERYGKVECSEYMGEEAVIFPGREISADIIAAFDVMLNFLEYIVYHQRGNAPVAVRFFISSDEKNMQEINILPVNSGEERNTTEYTENYITEINDADSGALPSWIFLIRDKEQMKLIRPKADYSFALAENGETVFYEGG